MSSIHHEGQTERVTQSPAREREDLFKIQQDRDELFKIQQDRDEFFKIQQERKMSSSKSINSM